MSEGTEKQTGRGPIGRPVPINPYQVPAEQSLLCRLHRAPNTIQGVDRKVVWCGKAGRNRLFFQCLTSISSSLWRIPSFSSSCLCCRTVHVCFCLSSSWNHRHNISATNLPYKYLVTWPSCNKFPTGDLTWWPLFDRLLIFHLWLFFQLPLHLSHLFLHLLYDVL